MKNIEFNSKETYLAHRSAWKAEYKQLSAEIRVLRQAGRFHQRSVFGHKPLTDAEHACIASATKLCAAGSFGYNRQRRRARATAMLAELKQAKAEAQSQYLARKAADTGPAPADD